MLKRIGLWGFVVVALAIVAWGAMSWAVPGASCRGVEMGPGDVCAYASRTSLTTDRIQTYEQRIEAARTSAPVIVVTGVAALAFGLALIRRDRAARDEGAQVPGER